MKFLSIHNGAGERFFPAFTDEKELEKFEMERDQQVSYLSFEDYVQLMADDRAAGGFVINPYGENLVCDRKTVASWMKHMKEIKTGVSLEEEPRIRLGRPKEMPAQLIQAVSEYLKEQDRVRAAYLSLIQPEGGKTGYLIVVDMEGNADTVFDKIAEACAPHLKGMPLAVEPLASELGQAAAKDREPFYLAQR